MHSRNKNTANWARIATTAACALALVACTSADQDLEQFITATKNEPGGPVAPLPEVKPYEGFAYSAQSLRSPFMPGLPGGSGIGGQPLVRPDVKRNREFLEQFSLDTLKMVGTLRLGGAYYGLVQTKEGLVQRVRPGNYMGQADGKVTEVTASKINLVEIVPDGLGGYMERPAAIGLSE
jgi:type IV pilus assembly protein PilP